VNRYFGAFVRDQVVRYTLPHLGAMNFVFDRPHGHSVTRSLALNTHGKSLSSWLLAMEIPDRDDKET